MEDAKKTGPKDVFFQLFAIILLYVGAADFGVLLFQYINLAFFDPLGFSYGSFAFHYGPLRWAIATLVIVFPVYLWTNWRICKDLHHFPEKRELKTRKWLLHFTLFAAAAIIIGDLVTLVYNFLEGELTFRFILKIFAVLFITAVVFTYYLWDLKQTIPASVHPIMKFFVWGVIGLISIAIITGFFIAGSPYTQRLQKFDERRVFHLQNIQGEIVNFWQTKGRLPNNLNELKDSISGYTPPLDPQDKSSYEYKILGNLQFELCANFTTDSKKTREDPYNYPRYDGEDNWTHGKGRTCFTRTIDPARYPYRTKTAVPYINSY